MGNHFSSPWQLLQVSEVHRLLRIWYPITMEVALELLDYHYADEKVRTLAVKRIAMISNSELKNFLLQLVQVCTYLCYKIIVLKVLYV